VAGGNHFRNARSGPSLLKVPAFWRNMVNFGDVALISGARPGDLAAILGIGGRGHLAVQFAAKMGFAAVAIARGKDKEALAKKLGALHYIDSSTQIYRQQHSECR
jgi:D-arabinose 1-dehydrogenase-like Zn-dependent alcohol dehydrogenase